MNFQNLPVLSTERLILRALLADDVDDIYNFTSNPLTSEWLTWYPHKSKKDTQRFIESVLERYKNNQPSQWVIYYKSEAKVLGLCGFVAYSDEHLKGEVAYVVSPEYWSKGILTEALTAIIEYSFKILGLIRIEAKCEVNNLASEKVMQKVGMHFEGFFQNYLIRKGLSRDYKIYAITRNEFNY